MKRKTAEFLISYRQFVINHGIFLTVFLLVLHCLSAVLIFYITPIEADSNWSRLWNHQYFHYLQIRLWIVLPMVLDLLIDFRNSVIYRTNQVDFSRTLMTFVIVVPAVIQYYLPYHTDPSFSRNAQGVLVLSQTSLIIGTLMALMYRTDEGGTQEDKEKEEKREFCIQLGNIHSLLLTFLMKIFFLLARLTHHPVLSVLTVLTLLIAGIHLFWVITQQSLKLYSERVNGYFHSHRSFSDFLHMLVLMIYTLAIFLYFVIAYADGTDFLSAGGLTLASSFGMVSQVLFVVLLTVIPMRVNLFHARLEGQRLKGKLETIRYVSHEMRSPLNTVMMGLKCVEDQLLIFFDRNRHQTNSSSPFHQQTGSGVPGCDNSQLSLGLGLGNGLGFGLGGLEAILSQDEFSPLPSARENFDQDGNDLRVECIESSESFAEAGEGGLRREGTFINTNTYTNKGGECEEPEYTQSSRGLQDILHHVENVRANCDVVLATLNDLLMADKLEEDKLSLDLCPLDPWALVQQVARTFSPAAQEKDIRFSVVWKCPGELSLEEMSQQWELSGDMFKLGQVIRNFFSNAFKFTPPKGTVTVLVEFVLTESPVFSGKSSSRASSKRRGDLEQGRMGGTDCCVVRISVTDSGAGVSKENQDKLFGQYVQFDAAKLQQGKGSGLGLWISKRIIELHGGIIGAHSPGEGLGSTFFFELELQPTSDLQLELEPTADLQLEVQPGGVENKKQSLVPPLLLRPPLTEETKISFPFFQKPGPVGEKVFPLLPSKVSTKQSLKVSARSIYDDDDDESSLDEEIAVPHLRRIKTFNNTNSAWNYRGSLSSARSIQSARSIHSARSTASYERSSISRYTAKVSPSLIPDCDCEEGLMRYERGLRVLVVDDSLLTRKLVVRLLVAEGHQVEELSDGAEFLQWVKEGQVGQEGTENDCEYDNQTEYEYDVVLMDDSMPGMCGPDAVKEGRACGYKGLVIGVTGNVFKEQINRYLDCGANLMLQKPLDLDRLKEALCCFLCPTHGGLCGEGSSKKGKVLKATSQSR